MSDHESSVIMHPGQLRRVLTRIAHEIVERNPATHDLVVAGVQRGGVHLASRLGAILSEICQHPVAVGNIDVGMYRDDLDQQAARPVHPTEIPCDINGKSVILIDDVLFSGRTTRAALTALHDLGRPKCIQLAVLIDRGHRELPIKPDFVGKNVPTSLTQHIDVQLKEEGGRDEVHLRSST